MKARHRRFGLIVLALAALAVGAALVLNAFRSNLVFFFTPTQVFDREAPVDRSFRLGGLVEAGSVQRQGDGLGVQFRVTDTGRTIPVVYRGLLPDLFREGKGVVTQGRLHADGVFHADVVLAKHDENYMPPEAAQALQQAHQAKAAATLAPPATAAALRP
jgi:cytochrome c-type biogenesis protein CcmE